MKKKHLIVCDICHDLPLIVKKAPNQKRHIGCRTEWYKRYHKKTIDEKRGLVNGIQRPNRHTELYVNRPANLNRGRRTCLKCGGKFMSESISNRICASCKLINQKNQGTQGTPILTGNKKSGGD